MNNVAFIFAFHQSEKIRPNGFYIVDRLIQSIHKYCNYNYTIYLFDNTSEDSFPLENYKGFNIKYEYIENQTVRGLTGAWNDGVLKSIEDNNDLIIICNDDLILNNSINTFIKEIENQHNKDKCLYGPLCQPQGVLGGPQGTIGPTNTIQNVTGGYKLNGFLLAFTKKFYLEYKLPSGEFLNPSIFWGGGEIDLQQRLWKSGASSVIIGSCWIYHEKIRSWKVHDNPGGNQAKMTKEQRIQFSIDKLKDYEDNWKNKFELLN